MSDLLTDPEEYKRKKSDMERSMLVAINKIIDEFWRATGMTPNDISIHMTETSTFGEARRQYRIIGVNTDIEI